MSSKPVLTYFDSKGRGEAARWLLAQAAVDYEDRRLTMEQWKEIKADTPTPTGQLPLLTIDGVNLAQSGAVCHYLAARYGMNGSNDMEAAVIHMIWDSLQEMLEKPVKAFYAKDQADKDELSKAFADTDVPWMFKILKARLSGGKEWLVGDKISLADIAVAWVIHDLPGPLLELTKQQPEIYQLYQRVIEQPNIKAWIETRPKEKQ